MPFENDQKNISLNLYVLKILTSISFNDDIYFEISFTFNVNFRYYKNIYQLSTTHNSETPVIKRK